MAFLAPEAPGRAEVDADDNVDFGLTVAASVEVVADFAASVEAVADFADSAESVAEAASELTVAAGAITGADLFEVPFPEGPEPIAEAGSFAMLFLELANICPG